MKKLVKKFHPTKYLSSMHKVEKIAKEGFAMSHVNLQTVHRCNNPVSKDAKSGRDKPKMTEK